MKMMKVLTITVTIQFNPTTRICNSLRLSQKIWFLKSSRPIGPKPSRAGLDLK